MTSSQLHQTLHQLTCWISGFFFWFFALYLVFAIIVYHKLMW